MTQDEIIRMARDGTQSYLVSGGLFNPEAMNHDKVRELIMLCRDALDLVAAHERDACAVCPSWDTVDDAIAAEREACAKVCESKELRGIIGNMCAAAIRARVVA